MANKKRPTEFERQLALYNKFKNTGYTRTLRSQPYMTPEEAKHILNERYGKTES